MKSATDIGELARETRMRLGFGNEAPLPDILQVVEEGAGVAVTLLRLPDRLVCAYASRHDQGFIFVNAYLNLDQQRFALAHAYGHHVLKHVDVLDDYDNVFGEAKAPAEVKANRFAVEFLLPRPAVARSLAGWRLADTHEATQPQTVYRLARYFGVSPGLASAQIATARSPATGPLEQGGLASYNTLDNTENGVWTPYTVRRDSLSDAQDSLPRLPAALQAATISAYICGDLTLAELAEILQRDQADVKSWLTRSGITTAG